MLKVHTTREGASTFISQMEDDHLKNTITMYLSKISQLKGALEAKVNVSPFKAALYEVDVQVVSETAKKHISAHANKLYPYLAEAMLRGFDFSKELRVVFERDGQEALFLVADGRNTLTYEGGNNDY